MSQKVTIDVENLSQIDLMELLVKLSDAGHSGAFGLSFIGGMVCANGPKDKDYELPAIIDCRFVRAAVVDRNTLKTDLVRLMDKVVFKS